MDRLNKTDRSVIRRLLQLRYNQFFWPLTREERAELNNLRAQRSEIVQRRGMLMVEREEMRASRALFGVR